VLASFTEAFELDASDEDTRKKRDDAARKVQDLKAGRIEKMTKVAFQLAELASC